MAPNFFKECATQIFPKNNLKVYFLPGYKNSFVYIFFLKLHFSKNISKRIRYAFWYLFNLRKYELILGWLDLGILASFINFFSISKKKKIYLILYYIDENKIKTNKCFAFFYKIVSKGTFKLISLDSFQTNKFKKILNRNNINTINLIYGVNSKWYSDFLNNEFEIQKKSIFSPGGAFRNDTILINTFKSLNYTVRRFQTSDLENNEVKIENIGNSVFEYYSNVKYEQYINVCLKSEFVIISVYNSDKPVGLTSLLECMSLGKTIFISRGLSSNDYIVDFETGLIFDDEVDLLSKLLFLEKNPVLSKQIGLNAKKAAREIFDLEITAENLVNIILN